VVGRQNADIADTLQLKDVAMATTFGFRCAITSQQPPIFRLMSIVTKRSPISATAEHLS